MPEIIAGKKAFSLYEVSESIRKVIAERYTSRFWVKAEMNKLNHYSKSGHCYPELLQKDKDKIVAEFRAVLWRPDYARINAQFMQRIHEPLRDGIKILFETSISYDAQYGITLRIHDIDINYTIGDLEAEKQASIALLQEQGIFAKNKSVAHPLLPRRIAIISVDTSKGYADFIQIITAKKESFTLFHMLFPALLQGDKAVASIIEQLERIRKVASHFDLVAIIRGGGGEVGLTCFNHYELAKRIATFPLPVYTGIGHATNETVCEMVSHFNGITPTKVAEHILEQFEIFEQETRNAEHTICSIARQIISNQKKEIHLTSRLLQQSAVRHTTLANENMHTLKARMVQANRFHALNEQRTLQTCSVLLKKSIDARVHEQRTFLDHTISHLPKHTEQVMRQQQEKLAQQERLVSMLDPRNTLKRGYSITTKNGKAVHTFEELKPGDLVSTQLYEGTITSIVQQSHTDEQNTNL
jgi:exodeoxyribonuclease VII large subunit